MFTPRLIIIGAGPKAMAIAAKNFVLRELGLPVPDLHIIEKSAVAAHWTGDGGFTNGRLNLGTAPEKDVGFPYRTHGFGQSVDERINERMREFSWQSYLVATHEFSDWVDRGKPAPQHRQWAAYLKWVYDRVKPGLTCTRGEVTQISLVDNRWKVLFLRPNEGVREAFADGIVLTGPGATRLPFTLPTHERVLTVESFWARYETFRKAGRQRVLLVGTGENAAAIAMSLAGIGNDAMEIEILAPRGMTYTRGESFQENRVYSSAQQGNWDELSEADRKTFIRRTDRGVFSQYAQKLLDGADGVKIVPGRLVGLEPNGEGKVIAMRTYDERTQASEYDYVIVATGSDPLAFLTEKMDLATEREILKLTGMNALTLDHVERSIDESLSISGLTPRLHVPMLSGLTQGPGFANLSCLGRLADRILAPYAAVEKTVFPRLPDGTSEWRYFA